MGEVTLTGTIVEKDPASPLPPNPNGGLYLYTDANQLLALITDFMATQASKDFLHGRSRPAFESHLGKKVTVSGYLSGRTLWSATIVS